MTALLACQCGTGEVRKIVVSAVATFNVRLAGARRSSEASSTGQTYQWAAIALASLAVLLCTALNAGERPVTPFNARLDKGHVSLSCQPCPMFWQAMGVCHL